MSISLQLQLFSTDYYRCVGLTVYSIYAVEIRMVSKYCICNNKQSPRLIEERRCRGACRIGYCRATDARQTARSSQARYD